MSLHSVSSHAVLPDQRKKALSSWRISLSHLTTQEELDGFLRAFDACYTRLTQL